MERVVGVEPTFSAWKAVVLPLDDTRVNGAGNGNRTRASTLARSRSTIEPYPRICYSADAVIQNPP